MDRQTLCDYKGLLSLRVASQYCKEIRLHYEPNATDEPLSSELGALLATLNDVRKLVLGQTLTLLDEEELGQLGGGHRRVVSRVRREQFNKLAAFTELFVE